MWTWQLRAQLRHGRKWITRVFVFSETVHTWFALVLLTSYSIRKFAICIGVKSTQNQVHWWPARCSGCFTNAAALLLLLSSLSYASEPRTWVSIAASKFQHKITVHQPIIMSCVALAGIFIPKLWSPTTKDWWFDEPLSSLSVPLSLILCFQAISSTTVCRQA